MPILDFKEIAQANNANGKQDTFELFARDFLEMLGFKIDSCPDRGPDGGKDMIVIEKSSLTESNIKWLVSCKHYAHSGKAVGEKDEEDIAGRMAQYNADCFMGIYSTNLSSMLNVRLKDLSHNAKISTFKIFDREKIESLLFQSEKGQEITKRYFSKSYNNWINSGHNPSNFLPKYIPLKCEYCGKDLLSKEVINNFGGIIVFMENKNNNNRTKEKIYWAHKGNCNNIVQSKYSDFIDSGWEDISDIIIPTRYVMWLIAILNAMQSGELVLSDKAYKELNDFIITVSQLVLRQQSKEEFNRMDYLINIYASDLL
jgi:hypothetical protein